MSIFKEGVELLKMIIGESTSSSSIISSIINFDGNYFKINGIAFKKPLQKIPITIAAKNNKIMGIAANYADIWETSYLSPDQFLLSKEVLRGIYLLLRIMRMMTSPKIRRY